MARTGHSTNMTSGRHRARQPQSQKLTDKEILELKNYLPEWTAAKRSEKRGIFTAIARVARLFAPKVDQKQWKKRKQVYKTWLFNNKKKKERKDTINTNLQHHSVCYLQLSLYEAQLSRATRAMRAPFPRFMMYTRARFPALDRPIAQAFRKHPSTVHQALYIVVSTTPRMVVYQQKREEVLKRIEDESGGKARRSWYLEKAKETAEEWSNNCPPPEIQAQVARKKGPAYMEHFSNEMWRQCGMRVFVMSAWKNEKGEVLFGMHDDNEALGDGDSFMKTKDWEDIEPVWQEYAQEQFGAGARDGGLQVKGGRKRIRKPAFKLEMDREGMPLLPDITDTKLEEKKAIGYVPGKDKVVVPWSAIMFDLKEPSKLQNWDTTALLHFWHAWQETGEGPTFLFKAWKNKDGDMVPSVISGKSPSPQTSIVRKQQRVTIRGPRDSSTEAESDKESATNHTEDDVDDDLADGRHPLKKPRMGGPTPKGMAVPHAIPKPRRPSRPKKVHY
ncbi:uncharacterized protein HD556DRAFT_1464070 [Suillus plorans]|uniref:Uncharacterized protein n=1 Tax=Suillus plorans TaxID=116603 RepID=A0A9P7J0X0_9AGAM|nr:uncharacterized protein HD556DRAFT_1464070 [Suillus plorans]KAG1798285.1 hypothetical protein HD556DRAFT_1464070 [Suillus plorans]